MYRALSTGIYQGKAELKYEQKSVLIKNSVFELVKTPVVFLRDLLRHRKIRYALTLMVRRLCTKSGTIISTFGVNIERYK